MTVPFSKRTHLGGIPISQLSLATLAIQNAALILVMHYSRIQPLPSTTHRYFTSTAVFFNEVLKLILSILFSAYELTTPETSWLSVLQRLRIQVFSPDSWKLAIPAALYTFQNSLQYVAVSNLDAATFQVTYQLKILTTAIFSMVMLQRSFSFQKWVSLFLLMLGIAVVQIPTSTSSPTAQHGEEKAMNSFVGLAAVSVACILSGLAGVYFEKVLKDSSQVNLWVRNIQLSFYSLCPAALGIIFKDSAAIRRDGFFAGYNGVVWTAVVFQAVGGLLVALVVQYTDNIAKNFATSISIVVSFIVSVWLFDFVITVWFVTGMCVVIYATYLYSSPDRKSETPVYESVPECDEEDEESGFELEKEDLSAEEKV